MPYRRRRKRPAKKKRMYRRRYKRKLRVRNILHLAGGKLPPRAYVKHKFSREVRLTEPYILNPITAEGTNGAPVCLIASCNNPTGPINKVGSATNNFNDENAPAFMPDVNQAGQPSPLLAWDINVEPNLFSYFARMYTQFTVVGSKIRINYKPFTVSPAVNGQLSANETAYTFILLRTPGPRIIQGGSGTTFPSPTPSNPNQYPSVIENQPYTKVIDYTSVDNWTRKNGVTLSMAFSAKKDFGKGKGNVVGEENLQGNSSARPSTNLTTAVAEQSYWQLYILPKIGNQNTVTAIQPGIFSIDIEYSTVWTERAVIPVLDAS